MYTRGKEEKERNKRNGGKLIRMGEWDEGDRERKKGDCSKEQGKRGKENGERHQQSPRDDRRKVSTS